MTYQGDQDPSSETLKKLSPEHRLLLRNLNGFIAFRGGIHLRGSCIDSPWHSIERAMTGDLALYRLFDAVLETDVPFAQDCLADQWLLREGAVFQLSSETGDVSSTGLGLEKFLSASREDPLEILGLHPLWAYLDEQELDALDPGYVLVADPPFCLKESANGVRLSQEPVEWAIRRLANLAAQVSQSKDGERVTLQKGPPN